MATDATQRLARCLKEAHAMEKQALRLLRKAASIAGDAEIAGAYR